MTRIAPISRAVLDAVLLNDHMESVLVLGGGPQSLALKLSNLTDYDIALPKGTTVTLTFRPGALVDADKVSATGTGWDVARQGTHLPSLVLTRDSDGVIAAGEEMIVMLSNLIPSANGASRSTRVELAYDGIKVGDGDALTGRRTVHLSLLYPNVPMGQVLGHKGITGSFKAELVGSADIRSGRKENKIRVRLSASAPVPIKANASMLLTDDCAKVRVAFPMSEDSTGQGQDSITFEGDIITPQDGALVASNGGAELAAFGASRFDGPGLRRNTPAIALANAGGQQSSGTVSVVMDRWQSHSDTIFYASASEEPLLGDFLEFGLSIKTALAPGAYPLTIRIENVNGQNVDVALLLNVTAFAMPGTDPVDAYIDAPGQLTITSSKTVMEGQAEIKGALTAHSTANFEHDLSVKGTARFEGQVKMWGHLMMYPFEGAGKNGTVYVQAREFDTTTDLSMQFRTQKKGKFVDALRLTSDGDAIFNSNATAQHSLTVEGSARFKSQVDMWGHLKMFAYEGEGKSGTAYLQARDDSANVDLSMQLRTQKKGNYVDALRLTPDGHMTVGGRITSKGLTTSGNVQLASDWSINVTTGQLWFTHKGKKLLLLESKGDMWFAGKIHDNATIT